MSLCEARGTVIGRGIGLEQTENGVFKGPVRLTFTFGSTFSWAVVQMGGADVNPFVKALPMDEKTFQTKLANLMGEINTLPEGERKKLANLADQTRERHDKMKKTVSDLQESLDYLRLSIKYLVFDLEATRRENKYLRDLMSKQDADANDGPSLEDDHDDEQAY